MVEELFRAFNQQIERAGFIARKGHIIDASLVSVPKQRISRQENVSLKWGEAPEPRQEVPAKLRQEDACRTHTGHVPANLILLWRAALNILHQETLTKGGLQAKCLRAGWNLLEQVTECQVHLDGIALLNNLPRSFLVNMTIFSKYLRCCSLVQQATTLPWGDEVQHLLAVKIPEASASVCNSLRQYFPESILRSTPKRQYEYAVGRLMVSELLSQVSEEWVDYWLPEHNRRPIWPAGIIGSISHSDSLVAVAIGMQNCPYANIGIDIESITSDRNVVESLSLCFRDEEIRILDKLEHGLFVGFAAKEALYKCLNPLTNRFIDFLDAEVLSIDFQANTIMLMITKEIGLIPRKAVALTHFRIFKVEATTHVWAGIAWQSP